MSTTALDKIKLLPMEKQLEVEDFIEYLLQKYKIAEEKASNELIEQRRCNLGQMNGKIWTAEDFNETPDDFKDYI